MAPSYELLIGLLLASSCFVDGSPLRALRQSEVVPAGDPTAVAVNLVRQVRRLHLPGRPVLVHCQATPLKRCTKPV